MVDWASELGIDLAVLHVEAFWHPVAQWENDRIRRQGEDYWAWRRLQNPEPPTPVAVRESSRPSYEFTDRQLQIAMGLVHADI
jgi:hypothetical protein